MFKVFTEILEELRINNKLLAKISGVSADDLQSLSLKKVDFSDTGVYSPISDENLLEEEDRELEDKIRARFDEADKKGAEMPFYEEELVEDLNVEY